MSQAPKRSLVILFTLALLSVVYLTAVAPRLGQAVLYVPQTDSLQPIPDAVGPNLQENIQAGETAIPEQSESSRETTNSEEEESNATTTAENAQDEEMEEKTDSQLFFWLTAVLVACLIGLSWWTYRSTSKKKKLE